MVKAMCPGSFDPLTLGHFDIIKRCSTIFDEVIVVVGYNESKKGLLPFEKRVEYIKDAFREFTNVSVTAYSGLTVDFAKENGVDVIVKGIRNSKDLDYENEMTTVNRTLSKDKFGKEIETLYMYCKPEYMYTSSSLVRSLIEMKLPVDAYVHNTELLMKLLEN